MSEGYHQAPTVAIARADADKLLAAIRRRAFRWGLAAAAALAIGGLPAMVAIESRGPGFSDALPIAVLFIAGPAVATGLVAILDREGRAARELFGWVWVSISVLDRIARGAGSGEAEVDVSRAAARLKLGSAMQLALARAFDAWAAGSSFAGVLATVRPILDPAATIRWRFANAVAVHYYMFVWLALSVICVLAVVALIIATPECASLGDPVPNGVMCH